MARVSVSVLPLRTAEGQKPITVSIEAKIVDDALQQLKKLNVEGLRALLGERGLQGATLRLNDKDLPALISPSISLQEDDELEVTPFVPVHAQDVHLSDAGVEIVERVLDPSTPFGKFTGFKQFSPDSPFDFDGTNAPD